MVGSGQAQSPDLEAGVYIQDTGGPIDVDAHLIPTCVDWNEDGAKDLLVGQYSDGNINLYLNQGSDFDPLFTGSVFLESGGVPITTSYG